MSQRPAALPIAVTGLGAVSAAGLGAAALRAALLAGRDGLRLHPDAGLPLAGTIPVGAIAEALPVGPRTVALGELAGREALADADLRSTTGIGLILGSCTGGMREGEAVYLGQGPLALDAAYGRQPVGNTAARLARRLGLRGPLSAHAEACASAACALVEAVEWIRAGLTPAVLVVGSDALTRLTLGGFASLQVIDPQGCRPFTVERNGMSLGEGACALVLEHPDHARGRGARVRAALLGWGLAADAHHATAPDPSGTWLEQAIRQALDDGGIAARDIGYAVAHGTGTRDNDASESAALGRLFGALPTASHKRATGHTMGAAAAFGAFAAVTAVETRTLLPSAGATLGSPMPGIDVVTTARPQACAAVLMTCLAFGGVDAALVFGGPDRCR